MDSEEVNRMAVSDLLSSVALKRVIFREQLMHGAWFGALAGGVFTSESSRHTVR